MTEPYFLDASHHQSDDPKKPIDWPLVKSSGIQKAYLKASEGNGFVDSAFATNWAGAKAVSIQRGAYMFFRVGIDGKAQATHFKKTVGSDLGELPPAVDVEDGDGFGPLVLTARLIACLLETEALFGQKPVIYTSQNAWNTLTTKPTWVKDYALWLAAPGTIPPPLPANATSYWLWQYSFSGTVSGIVGVVDLNRENVLVPVPPDDASEKINKELDQIGASVLAIRGEL